MNDLLGSVKGNSLYAAENDDDEFMDMEQQATPISDADKQMQEFFKKVEDIKRDMAQIKSLQTDIVAMHEKGKTIVKSKEMQKHRDAMQAKINEVSTIAHKVKAKVEALDKDNDAAKKKKGQGEGTANERTRSTISMGLKKKLKDTMGEFSALRDKIQEEYRELVERRIFTVTGQKVADEDIDHMIETGESENIFQTAIMEQGRGRVLDTLAEIQERHRAVKDLEQSLLELHQIFLDMAVLVEAQGEMLDNIEKQVAKSVDYVKGGTEALQTAKQLQKNTRKWMCIGIGILLIIAVIVVCAGVRPWRFISNNRRRILLMLM